MGFRDTAARLIGGAPLARSLAAEQAQYVSRFGQSDHLAHLSWADWLGVDVDSLPVTRSRAMRIGTVAAGRNTIAGTVGRLPLFTSKDDRRTDVQPSLLKQPERGVPLSTTLTWTVDTMIFYPAAYWVVVERDAAGWPTFVKWVSPGSAGFDTDGRLTSVDGKPVDPTDVIRFDSPLGAGLLADGADIIRRAVAINRAASYAEANPVPSIELHNEGDPLNPDEVKKLVEDWRAARASGGVAYTPKSLKVNALGQNPEQLIIDGRKEINLELVRMLNIPAWAAASSADGTSLQYENRSSRNWELLDITCAPFMSAIVDRLSLADVTPNGWKVRFDTDDLTKPDQKTRFDAYAVGKANGFVTNDMIADWERWSTVPPEPKDTQA